MLRRSSNGQAVSWRALLALLALVLTAACSKNTDITNIGVGLPSVQTNTGAYLVDTLTMRTSTVLRDSVVTSTSGFLLVGQATDPLLGKLTAKSYFRLGIANDNFKVDPSFVYDSLVLVLPTDAYRFGDTTRTQTLFEVHELTTPLSSTKPSFASPRLTPLTYDATVLNQTGGVRGTAPVGRARPNLAPLRLRLRDDFGQRLMTAGQSGLYQTQDAFDAFLNGLALVPAANDDAALVRLSATNGSAALALYYHDPNVTGQQNYVFSVSTGARHAYQVTADRSAAGVVGLPATSLQAVAASATGQQTFIEGALGLQTKLEIPYLTNLAAFGNNLTITNAQITAYVPAYTITPYVPTPPALTISGSNTINQPIGNYGSNVSYQVTTSPITGLPQGSYTWPVLTYIQAVLNHSIPNNGLLLSSATPDLPTRVVLADPRNATATNRLQLRVYLIQVQ